MRWAFVVTAYGLRVMVIGVSGKPILLDVYGIHGDSIILEKEHLWPMTTNGERK